MEAEFEAESKRFFIGTCAAPLVDAGSSLANLLVQQPSVGLGVESRPLLPWGDIPEEILLQRISRLKQLKRQSLVVDIAGFYARHLERILAVDPTVCVVHLRVSEQESINCFTRVLNHVYALPVNHWAETPGDGWQYDPDWSRCYPKYDLTSREECIRRYWQDYEAIIEALRQRFPERILITSPEELTREEGVQRVLDFVGIASADRTIYKRDPHAISPLKMHPRSHVRGREGMDPARCAILVPFNNHIVWETECVLRQLEARGYPVRRFPGVSAIDQARSQLATDALIDGYDEMLWIDSDMCFTVDDVERIRSHGEPLVAGLYSKRGGKSFAAAFLPGTEKITFGNEGGLVEILYAATGFLLVRREVYLTMQEQLSMPVCNELFNGRPIIPFFQPITIQHEDAKWYLGEDYSFCHRARQCQFRIMADTQLRVWHIGSYRYGWEDVGAVLPRSETYHFTINK